MLTMKSQDYDSESENAHIQDHDRLRRISASSMALVRGHELPLRRAEDETWIGIGLG